MNKQIQQLMARAGTDTSGKWMSVDNAERFAELIVQEMLEITDAHTEVFQTDRDKALIEHISRSVKQHFGVDA